MHQFKETRIGENEKRCQDYVDARHVKISNKGKRRNENKNLRNGVTMKSGFFHLPHHIGTSERNGIEQ